jgi:hypothetical protein
LSAIAPGTFSVERLMDVLTALGQALSLVLRQMHLSSLEQLGENLIILPL